MEIDFGALELELCRIPEVRAARIITDNDDHPVEVHVLAAPGKHAKQLVRDVQSVAMATVGLELDHRIVSVVQLDEPGASPPAASPGIAPPNVSAVVAPAASDGDMAATAVVTRELVPADRVLLESVTATHRGATTSITVRLLMGDATAEGAAEGSAAISATNRLVADATLEALGRLEPAAARASLEMVGISHHGDRAVAIVTLVVVVRSYEEAVSGTALVRFGREQEAVARAVLDALNRRLAQLD